MEEEKITTTTTPRITLKKSGYIIKCIMNLINV